MRERRDIELVYTKYFHLYHTIDSFGFSVILNIDYWDLIVRVGTLVFVIGR